MYQKNTTFYTFFTPVLLALICTDLHALSTWLCPQRQQNHERHYTQLSTGENHAYQVIQCRKKIGLYCFFGGTCCVLAGAQSNDSVTRCGLLVAGLGTLITGNQLIAQADRQEVELLSNMIRNMNTEHT